MCLTKIHKTFKVADKELYTYKSLDHNLEAPYRIEFVYKLNKVYKLIMWGYLQIFMTNIKRGFHSHIKGEFFLQSYKLMVLCRIPKGSKYYLGDKGDIVSNKIEIVAKVPIEIIQKWNNENRGTNYKLGSSYCSTLSSVRYMQNYIKTNYPLNNLLNETTA